MEKKENDFISLNKEINTDFLLEQLENRKETDPLFLGNPLGAITELGTACFTCSLCFTCGEFL